MARKALYVWIFCMLFVCFLFVGIQTGNLWLVVLSIVMLAWGVYAYKYVAKMYEMHELSHDILQEKDCCKKPYLFAEIGPKSRDRLNFGNDKNLHSDYNVSFWASDTLVGNPDLQINANGDMLRIINDFGADLFLSQYEQENRGTIMILLCLPDYVDRVRSMFPRHQAHELTLYAGSSREHAYAFII